MLPLNDLDPIWIAIEQAQGRAAAAIRVALREVPIDPVNFTPESQQRRVESLKLCTPGTSDEDRHEEWVHKHIDEGWVFGEEFSSEHKTHPNLVPWEHLSRNTQMKTRIFAIFGALGHEIQAMLTPPDNVGSTETVDTADASG